MTEREKMLRGLLYDANYDEALCQERTRAKDLCWQYNQLPPSAGDERRGLLRRLLGKLPAQVQIESPFWCDYGTRIELGEYFYANHNTVILDAAPVRFGDHVFIGPNCGFYTAGHPLDAGRRNRGLEYAWPITVGSDVWFGAGVQVLPGVTIGSDVVIGAGSVVTRDIPSHSLAVGNPCRVRRALTAADREACWDRPGE